MNDNLGIIKVVVSGGIWLNEEKVLLVNQYVSDQHFVVLFDVA
jgi:hydrogenase maturation factor HypF (carbamoyltransferase family)